MHYDQRTYEAIRAAMRHAAREHADHARDEGIAALAAAFDHLDQDTQELIDTLTEGDSNE